MAFQTSTTNSTTGIYALPNGTSTTASWQATNAADPTNASKVLIATNGSTDVQLVSGINGTGTYLPLSFFTNGSGQFAINTSGAFGIGSVAGATVSYGTSGQLFVSGGSAAQPSWTNTVSAATTFSTSITSPVHYATTITSPAATNLTIQSAGTTAMTIDTSQNVGIGTTSPSAKLHVVNATGGTAISAGNANASLYVNYLDGGVNYIGGSTTVVRNGAGTTEFMRIDSSGNVGIGIALPAVNLDIYNSGTAAIRVQGDSTTQAQFSRFSTDASAPFILLKKARGTTASPVAVATGDIMGQVIYQAYGGTNNRNLGSINGIVTAYTSDTNIASALTFTTSAAGGVTAVEAMRIDSSGNVGIGTTSPNASAILDAQSTTKGVRFPNMTTTQKNAISSPAAGLVVFDTTLAKLCVYSGSAWQTITSI